MNLNLTSNQTEQIIIALNMRSCWIETGTVALRADDAIAQGNTKCLKILSPEQKELVRANDELVSKLNMQRMLG